MKLSAEHYRLREVREDLGLTQTEFGKILGLKSSTADIERGKTRITGRIVMLLFKNWNINPVWLYGDTDKKYSVQQTTDVLPKAITVDKDGSENILLVNEKASAGYGANIGDSTYYKQLPAFGFPLPEFKNATFRGFEIKGDSMQPLVQSGDWVLAQAVATFKELVNHKIYIVVDQESIRLKKVVVEDEGKSLSLISLNPEYPPVQVLSEDVLEIWQYHSKLTIGQHVNHLTLEELYHEVVSLKKHLLSSS
ncbi:MAG: XRE family transcriptional regulator [Flavobacteriales bacterium]